METGLFVGVFVLIGMGFHFLDEKRGVKWYAKYWGWTHKDPLPEGRVLGFICGRRTAERAMPAIVIVVIACLVRYVLGAHDIGLLLLKAVFLMFPSLLIGFALAGLLRKNPMQNSKVSAAMSAVDKLEAGEVNLKDVAKDIAAEALSYGAQAAEKVREAAGGKVVKPAASQPVEQPPVQPVPVKKNFRDALDDYSKRS